MASKQESLQGFADILKASTIRERGKQAYEEAIETMKREVIEQRENLLREFLAQENDGAGVTQEETIQRGYFKPYSDGILEFIWDNNVRLRFFPPKFVNIEGIMKPVQQFERVAAPNTERIENLIDPIE